MLKVIETSAKFDRAVSLMEKSDRRGDDGESLNPEEKVGPSVPHTDRPHLSRA
jgi:hypothetical protein